MMVDGLFIQINFKSNLFLFIYLELIIYLVHLKTIVNVFSLHFPTDPRFENPCFNPFWHVHYLKQKYFHLITYNATCLFI